MSDLSQKEKLLQEQIESLRLEIEGLRREMKDKIQLKEEEHQQEIAELEEKHNSKVDFLVKSLKTRDELFKKELTAQINLIKQSWSWRIIHILLVPVQFAIKLFHQLSELFNNLKRISHRLIGFPKTVTPASHVKDYNFQDQVKDEDKINLAVIFDKFTETCFSDEFNLIRFTPGNWKSVFKNIPVEGFFIESAWRGIGASWQNKIVNISSQNQKQAFKIIQHFKEKQVPTIFWNKEDPVHFAEFINIARKFDYIFTSDSNCIPDYKESAGHDKVFALPFAAQPSIHNPVRTSPRSGSVCFAGTYYNKKYAERRIDMDILLKPSLDFGLDIYDRNFGTAAERAGIYKFPDIYQGHIKGKLEYEDMINAYRNYKVFLNVNSVKFSPTMFARRVFELLACGTPVISTYSQGIVEILGEGTVLITESEEDTRRHLDALINDKNYWWRKSLEGMRVVMKNHTYQDRTKEIFSIVGLPFKDFTWPSFTILAKIADKDGVNRLCEMILHQHYMAKGVLFVSDNPSAFDEAFILEIKEKLKGIEVDFVSKESSRTFIKSIQSKDNAHLAIFDAHCHYGPHYLEDFALATRYSTARIFGKLNHFQWNGTSLENINEGKEYTLVDTVPSSTLVLSFEKLDHLDFSALIEKENFMFEGEGILSLDPFNYIHWIHEPGLSSLDRIPFEKLNI